jgi:hypothetical protein
MCPLIRKEVLVIEIVHVWNSWDFRDSQELYRARGFK